MAGLEDILQRGIARHQAGDLAAAEHAYRELLRVAPGHPDALNLLGVIALQSGHPAAAIDLISAAVEALPGFAVFHLNLGRAFDAVGRTDLAALSLRRSLVLDPLSLDAVTLYGSTVGAAPDRLRWQYRAVAIDPSAFAPQANLAAELFGNGQTAASLAHYRRLAKSLPPDPPFWNSFGNARRADGGDGAGAYRIALALAPAFAQAWINLDQAVTAIDPVCARRGVILAPGLPAAWLGWSAAALTQADLATAVFAARAALALDPTLPDASYSYAAALRDIEGDGAARRWLERCIELAPTLARAWVSLGALAEAGGQAGVAEWAGRNSVVLSPTLADGWCNLGNAWKFGGAPAAAIGAYARAELSAPERAEIHSNLVFLRQEIDDPAAFDEARRWADKFAPVVKDCRRQPGPRLRIGYLSPDFRAHSCAWFLAPLLAAHDRQRVEVFAYSDVARPDKITDDLMKMVEHWRAVSRLDDAALGSMIAADGIDVLVDLAGHTGHNRLKLFGARAAPVQVSWLGYNATTGLPAMDYRLCDWASAPAGMEGRFVERLWRIDRVAHCYGPPAGIAIEAPADRPFCFGSFNNLSKLSDATVALWAAVLRAVPASGLRLKSRLAGDGAARDHVLARFAAHGVDPARIALEGWRAGIGAHLAAYGDIDVALDPHPYAGTTTTCEALWMGVPVVTMTGASMMSRMSAAILDGIGRSDLVATTADEFVAVAVQAAAAGRRDLAVRQALRAQVAAAPLTDGPGFARAVEAAFSAMAARAGRREA